MNTCCHVPVCGVDWACGAATVCGMQVDCKTICPVNYTCNPTTHQCESGCVPPPPPVIQPAFQSAPYSGWFGNGGNVNLAPTTTGSSGTITPVGAGGTVICQ
jgi:hypothetical protein